MFLFIFGVFSLAKSHTENVEYLDDGLKARISHNFTKSQLTQISKTTEHHSYQADVDKLLNILIDSLYQNKDVFMRELISNANDALDKIRFQSIKDPGVLESGSKDFEILIDVNEEQKTISITDTGIGMTKEELIENLGRIAKSGTGEFQKMLQSGDTNLIGQFGVGFYSAFLVADKVTVISKSNNSTKQYIWESDASSQFNVVEDPRGVTLGRGTSVILHLKNNAYNYVDRDKLIGIIKHYSMFIDFPVKIWHYKDLILHEDDKKSEINNDVFGIDDVVEESDEDQKNKKNKNDYKIIKKRVWQWIQVNDRKPIWLCDPNEISESDYTEFFKMFFKEPRAPLVHTHFQAEGKVVFNSLLFIPSVPPPIDRLFEKTTRNIRLYVKRVLVADEWNDELLPTYLHFVKGVIDSNDLTLNVDRERLVKMNALKLIKRRITSKILSLIKNMFLNDHETYNDFYSKYGDNIKLGVVDDEFNKRILTKMLMFYSSYSPKKLTTLDEYVARMKKGQEFIYWIGAPTIEEGRNSPYIEDILDKGYEVLFAIEPIDVHCYEIMDEYEGIPLSNPEKSSIKNPNEKVQDVSGFNISQRAFNRYVHWFKKIIGDKMENMILTKRLKTTPAICSCTPFGYTASHERLLRAQTVHDSKLEENLVMNRKIFEVNFDHPTVKDLFERIKKNPKDISVIEDARLLYDTALLAGGFTLPDSFNFTKRVFRMIGRSYEIEDQVDEFEDENKVFYPTVEDEFEHEHKNDKKIYLGKNYKIGGEIDVNGEELPANLYQETPPECYQGILS